MRPTCQAGASRTAASETPAQGRVWCCTSQKPGLISSVLAAWSGPPQHIRRQSPGSLQSAAHHMCLGQPQYREPGHWRLFYPDLTHLVKGELTSLQLRGTGPDLPGTVLVCAWLIIITQRSNQSILREINPEYSLEGLVLKLKLQYSPTH